MPTLLKAFRQRLFLIIIFQSYILKHNQQGIFFKIILLRYYATKQILQTSLVLHIDLKNYIIY